MIQLQVLNYILSSGDSSIIEINNLNVGFFSEYKDEFKFIKNHLDAYGKVCDSESFISTFPHFEVIEVNEPTVYLVDELYNDYNTRKMAEVFNEVRTYIMNGDTKKAMEIYKASIEKFSTGVSLESVDLVKDTSRFDDYVNKTQDLGKYYISTGFKELDAIVGGFDRQDELATIVARTNYGKSWILLKCATSAAQQGLRVGIYSGEMSERKVGYRIDTLLGHINNGAITHGNISVLNDYKQYIDKLPTLLSGSIKVITPSMINGPATVNALKMFIEKENLDILFVDQLSLLEDQRRGKTTVDKYANISKDLKNLQVLKKISIISVCQQNRTTTDDGKQNTTQIAGTDRIGQDSTMIIFLEKKETNMKLTLGKSRDSEVGATLNYRVDLNLGIFTYIPSEEDGQTTKQETDDLEARYSNKLKETGRLF